MQGTLYCRDKKMGEFIVHGLKRENISLDVIDGSRVHRQDHILYQSSVFFFHSTLTREDLALIQLIRLVKPSSCVVLLDPADLRHGDAVDYIFSKPFSYPYMALLIQKNICEKRDTHTRQCISLGDMSLYLHKRMLSRNGQEISLRNKEFALLEYFFLNPGRVVSRADILECVWDRNSPITTNTVDVHISRLRFKLKLCDANAFLKTVPCIGYQWLFDVT